MSGATAVWGMVGFGHLRVPSADLASAPYIRDAGLRCNAFVAKSANAIYELYWLTRVLEYYVEVTVICVLRGFFSSTA